MRSHHDSFPAPFLGSTGPASASPCARRSPATAAAAHPASIAIASTASSSPRASILSRPASSCNKITPPTKQFTPTVRTQNTRPTPTNKSTRNSSPAHPPFPNCCGKLALSLVTPLTSTPTPTTTSSSITTSTSTTSASTPTAASACLTHRRRQPLAIRQDAANKMRNLHTSRASPINSNNTTNNKDHSAAASPAPRMPYDRSTPTAPSSRQQPQAPSLAKRTPVTPKLAAKNTSQPSQRQTVTLAAPVPRRSTRPESIVSQSTASNLGGSASKRVSVAPRHDNRQSRASSATTSPNPADGSADTWESRSGLGITAPSLDADVARRNIPASNTRDSKFFYASDAPKSAQPPTSAPRPTPPLAKGPTFFYANGTNLPPKPSPTSASPAPFSPTLAAPASDPLAGKFMYASGTPDPKTSPITTSGSASVTSTSSKRASSKVGSGPQSPAFLAQRAPSPAKVTSHPAAPTPCAPGPSIAERRSVLSSTPQLNNTSIRRISTEAPPRISSGHSRSGSLVAEPPSVTRTVATSPPVTSPLHSPLAFSAQGGLSMASVLQAAEEASDFIDHDDENESIVSGLTSPKSSKGDDPLNELVANARRERKVQDLQITNASLEAINRTLERQLRKQTNELRRFKRLSRAGRLSSANTAPSSRVVSDSATSQNPEGPLSELSLSDLSEEEEDDMGQDDEDLESELSEESSGSACRSPDSTTAARHEKYRKRDEKRLQIDLSKHQQLLVDSQKMNQSLKRCLGWTEELINEGKRALAYQVRVSEVDVSGRVAHEVGEKPFIYDGATLWDHSAEHHDHSLMDHNELSEDDEDDADETMRLRIERLRPADETDGNKSAQDRDSGIVLPGDTV